MPRYFSNYLLAKEYKDYIVPISLHLILFGSFTFAHKVIKAVFKITADNIKTKILNG